MKYTIEGFSQAYACSLSYTEVANGKTRILKLDCTDLVILRWFVDFFNTPKVTKIIVDGKSYAWINYNYLKKQLPIITINKRAIAERLNKMCKLGVLEFHLHQAAGNYTYYRLGKNYINLISDSNNDKSDCNSALSESEKNEGGYAVQTTKVCCSNDKGYAVQTTKVCCSNDKGYAVQTANKDSSIKDSSTKDSSFKDSSIKDIIKDERSGKEESYYPSYYPNDCELDQAFKDFLEMRKAKNKPLTEKAISIAINKLNKLSKGDNNKAIQILNESILNSWTDLFPLREEQEPKHKSFADLARERGLIGENGTWLKEGRTNRRKSFADIAREEGYL